MNTKPAIDSISEHVTTVLMRLVSMLRYWSTFWMSTIVHRISISSYPTVIQARSIRASIVSTSKKSNRWTLVCFIWASAIKIRSTIKSSWNYWPIRICFNWMNSTTICTAYRSSVVWIESIRKNTVSRFKPGIKVRDTNRVDVSILLFRSGTGPSLTTEKHLTIVLLDINDSPPVLDPYPTPISIEENNVANAQLIQFHAQDFDAPNTSNSLLTYSLVSSNHSRFFQLDPLTGLLSVAKNVSFDYERQSQYPLILNISDHGEHPKRLETLHSFTVYVNDTNDNSPQFERDSYSFQLNENVSIGTLIGQLKAIDLDTNSTIQYELTCLDDQDVFEVGLLNGQLRTKALLDYETHPTHRLYVTAKDNDHLHSTRVTVTVQLLDVNDHIPVIDPPPAVYIPSELLQNNVSRSILISSIVARDRDAGKNGNLTYTIIDGNQYGYFQINHLNGSINAETINLPQGHHRLTIKVCDHGEPTEKCSTSMVNIKIGEYVEKLYYSASFNYQQLTKSSAKNAPAAEHETIFSREMILVVLISTILTLLFSITMGILIAFFCKQKRCHHLHRSSLKKPSQLLQSTDADKLLTTTGLSSTNKVCSSSKLCHLRCRVSNLSERSSFLFSNLPRVRMFSF